MAYQSNDVQNLVGILNPEAKNDIRISTIKDKDGTLKSIDIRQYYTDNEGKKAPSPKGIRIREENLTELLEILLNNVNIETLLDIRSDKFVIETE